MRVARHGHVGDEHATCRHLPYHWHGVVRVDEWLKRYQDLGCCRRHSEKVLTCSEQGAKVVGHDILRVACLKQLIPASLTLLTVVYRVQNRKGVSEYCQGAFYRAGLVMVSRLQGPGGWEAGRLVQRVQRLWHSG